MSHCAVAVEVFHMMVRSHKVTVKDVDVVRLPIGMPQDYMTEDCNYGLDMPVD
jgi:hypothetical protein